MSHARSGALLLCCLVVLTAVSYLSRPDVRGSLNTSSSRPSASSAEASSTKTLSETTLAQPSSTRYVKAIQLNVRSAPNGAVVDTLSRGAPVLVYEEQEKWIRISPSDLPEQWVSGAHLCSDLACLAYASSESDSSYDTPRTMSQEDHDSDDLSKAWYVKSIQLNVRSAPNGLVVDTLMRDSPVQVYEVRGKWVRISRLGQSERWVSGPNLCSRLGCGNALSESQQFLVPASANTHSSGRSRSYQSRSYGCPCSGSSNCIGPRGGRYCITSGGNKRYR